MVILFVEHVTPSMRGTLSRWMIEPRAGVFVGNLSAMVRDRLWDRLITKAADCGVIMIHTAQTEQGFAIRTYGDTTRQVVDFEGLMLIKRLTPQRT